ncbi:MAG: type II toxin-antitoxin system HicA family toxin, partial [SAR324 cluster bacterium]
MGFQVVRQKGSHVIFSNGRDTFPVPKHGSYISRSGTSV